MELQSIELERIARRATRPQPVKSPVGADVREVAELLALDAAAARATYNAAAVIPPQARVRTLFSRAAVSALLTEFNARPVAYPSEPLLTLRQVRAVAELRGVRVSRAALAWSAWRSTHPNHAKNTGDAPVIEVVRVSVSAVRVTLADAADYIRAVVAYREQKS